MPLLHTLQYPVAVSVRCGRR